MRRRIVTVVVVLDEAAPREARLDELWSELSKPFGGAKPKPSLSERGKAAFQRLVARARKRNQDFEPPDPRRAFFFTAPDDEAARALVERAQRKEAIRQAYLHRPGPPPAHPSEAWQDPAFDPSVGLEPHLRFLDPAPTGIDARFAWRFEGDGTGSRLGLVEQGWKKDHEDLPPSTVVSGVSASDLLRVAHGTSSLGVACAKADNDAYGRGVAPLVAQVHLAAYVQVPSVPDETLWSAICFAADAFPPGEPAVLLVEAQNLVHGSSTLFGPAEVAQLEYDMIALATAAGVVVVEAGGNGSSASPPALDMDSYVDATGSFVLDPTVRDSGAIIVSAATANEPHLRLPYAPHGERVDCYAWGESVFAPSAKVGSSGSYDDDYTTAFSGTSSASAIVAGAALAVSSSIWSRHGVVPSPTEVRAALESFGTPVWMDAAAEAAGAAPIGVMPDLRRIFRDHLGVVPDVYVRDHVGDDGDPHLGPISASPDVFVRAALEPDPQAAFGEGSGTENDMTLGASVTAGQPHYVYVRLRNRGAYPATNVTATVYYAPVATLLTPDLWTLVGTTTVDMPPGDQLVVADPILWPATAIPGSGHYCFVCVVDHEEDRAPELAQLMAWDDFRSLIREENNVTWRNFNVVGVSGGTGGGFLPLPFMMPGAPGQRRRMVLELAGKLPRGARLALDIPDEHRARFSVSSQKARCPELLREARGLVTEVGRGGVLRVPATLAKRSRIALRALVQIPQDAPRGAYHVVARQLDAGLEVGRVTWRLEVS